MTDVEFNEKYGAYLVDGYYGSDIVDPELIALADTFFADFVRDYPDFKWYQLKLKFGQVRCYTSPDGLGGMVEVAGNKLLVARRGAAGDRGTDGD